MTPRPNALFIVTAITFARVPFVLLFMALALVEKFRPSPAMAVVATASLVIAAITDLFDGLLARRWRVVSAFGAMADPLMDKVFYLVVFPTLLYLLATQQPAESVHAVVMLVFTVLYILRDQWVSFLRSVASAYGADVRANWMGKLRTAISFPIGCIIYVYISCHPSWLPLPLIYALEAFAILVNLASIVVYTRQYLPWLRRAITPS
jgi:CDP-diacylglycerol--glycerol-3-phosphate 3-phosphatidyltransferase